MVLAFINLAFSLSLFSSLSLSFSLSISLSLFLSPLSSSFFLRCCFVVVVFCLYLFSFVCLCFLEVGCFGVYQVEFLCLPFENWNTDYLSGLMYRDPSNW